MKQLNSQEAITCLEFDSLDNGSYTLVDVRKPVLFQTGHINGAVNIAFESFETGSFSLDRKLPVILYCKNGEDSKKLIEKLNNSGYDVYYLKGGYYNWLSEQFKKGTDSRKSEIERSIQKKFHNKLFTRFARAINRYELLQPGDKVAVCISGGKDSMVMAKLFQELKRHRKFEFSLEFLVMDPGYTPMNRMVIEENAKLLGIPITIFESDIFDSVYHVEKSPCYLCARMRRGHLYHEAQKAGCNKIALGHHYDDVIETILMGMMYGGQVQTMMPKLRSTNFEGMELIRPMYFIREDDIKHWRDYNNLQFIQCACRFTEACEIEGRDGTSKRDEIKKLIKQLKETNPFIENNIFKSVENVNLDTVITYKKNGVSHDFLENYNK